MAKIGRERPLFVRHSRESGNPSPNDASGDQAGRSIPACAGTTKWVGSGLSGSERINFKSVADFIHLPRSFSEWVDHSTDCRDCIAQFDHMGAVKDKSHLEAVACKRCGEHWMLQFFCPQRNVWMIFDYREAWVCKGPIRVVSHGVV
ncbi:hypothetical protein [Sphingobium scionense]